MDLRNIFWTRQGKSQASILAIVLFFVLILVFIWLWYDLRLKALDSGINKPSPTLEKHL